MDKKYKKYVIFSIVFFGIVGVSFAGNGAEISSILNKWKKAFFTQNQDQASPDRTDLGLKSTIDTESVIEQFDSAIFKPQETSVKKDGSSKESVESFEAVVDLETLKRDGQLNQIIRRNDNKKRSDNQLAGDPLLGNSSNPRKTSDDQQVVFVPSNRSTFNTDGFGDNYDMGYGRDDRNDGNGSNGGEGDFDDRGGGFDNGGGNTEDGGGSNLTNGSGGGDLLGGGLGDPLFGPGMGVDCDLIAQALGSNILHCVYLSDELTMLPVCGNDEIEESVEQCDDGNTLSGDGCSSACLLEEPQTQVANKIFVNSDIGDDNSLGLSPRDPKRTIHSALSIAERLQNPIISLDCGSDHLIEENLEIQVGVRFIAGNCAQQERPVVALADNVGIYLMSDQISFFNLEFSGNASNGITAIDVNGVNIQNSMFSHFENAVIFENSKGKIVGSEFYENNISLSVEDSDNIKVSRNIFGVSDYIRNIINPMTVELTEEMLLNSIRFGGNDHTGVTNTGLHLRIVNSTGQFKKNIVLEATVSIQMQNMVIEQNYIDPTFNLN